MGRIASAHRLEPWNKGKLVGQKAPLRVKDIWGYPRPPSDAGASPRSGIVQPRN
jgi:hypothetical protein